MAVLRSFFTDCTDVFMHVLFQHTVTFSKSFDLIIIRLYTVLLRNNLTENAFGTRPERARKCVPFAFHLRSIWVPFAFRLRSICVPKRSNLRSAFTGTHPGTRSCNTRDKNGCHRKLS